MVYDTPARFHCMGTLNVWNQLISARAARSWLTCPIALCEAWFIGIREKINSALTPVAPFTNMTYSSAYSLGPFLLTWFNFNPSMDK